MRDQKQAGLLTVYDREKGILESEEFAPLHQVPANPYEAASTFTLLPLVLK